MGYAVYGYIKDETCTPISGATVYPYFKKVDSGSDPSKWSTNPYYTDANGYYSFDIEDADLLDTTGNYKKGQDKFYVAVVANSGDINDQTKESLTFTNASFFVHTLVAGADTFQFNFSAPLKRSPIIDTHSFPAAALLTKHNYTMSETSHADTTWELEPCYGSEVSQKSIYDLVPIFPGHTLKETIYSWDEKPPVVSTTNSSDTYQFSAAGNYNLKITVWENWNTFTEVTQAVTVKYNAPTPDFHWTPTQTNSGQIKGQETITFTNDTSDLDGRSDTVYTYDWTIEDTLYDGLTDNTQTVSNVGKLIAPTHQFQSPGTKNVTLKVYWNDGFNDLTDTITKQIVIHPFDIVPSFSWTPDTPENRGQTITFDPDSTSGDVDKIVKYDWIIEDNYPAPDPINSLYTFSDLETSKYNEGSPDNTVLVDNEYTFANTHYPTLKFHSVIQKNAALTITYYNGWVNVTESISKTVTPSKYDLTPNFSASNYAPRGRAETVTLTNTTSDTNLLQYTIDWLVSDYFMECNLDNPTPGVVADNSDEALGVIPSTTFQHNYQNIAANEAKLVIRYDDGWQMKTEEIAKDIDPVVYPSPTPDFSWSPLVPVSRDVQVTFSDETSDPDARHIASTWVIVDKFDINNPDNPDYGGSEPDNTATFSRVARIFQPTHFFQKQEDKTISLEYFYDDGFCEKSVQVNQLLGTDLYTLNADFTTDTLPVNDGFVGKIEVVYTNTTPDPSGRMLDVDWEWNDRDGLNLDADHISNVNDAIPSTPQPFTFMYPSRSPFSAIGGDTVQNINKDVYLNVRYDDGWQDQAFTSITKNYEASPKELSSEISYNCNITNYTH